MTTNRIQLLLDYHEIEGNHTDGQSFSITLDNRSLIFTPLPDNDGYEVALANDAKERKVIIKYDEFEGWIDNPTFPFIRIINDNDGIDRRENFRPLSATDLSVRLSLCFPGDIVKITRKVLFTGAGMHREIMVMKVE